MCETRYIFPVAAIAMLSFPGCEQDLDLDKYKNPEIEKMLVVNSILNPDSVIGVSVTHPYFFSDSHVAFSPVTNLEVQAAGEDREWETLIYDDKTGIYLSKYKPVAGEALKLRVEQRTGIVCSCDTVPYKVAIEGIEVSGEGPMHIYWDNDYRFTYKITFRDIPGKDNFYFLEIMDDAQRWEFSQMGQVDYTADYVFQELANMINQDIQGWQPDGVFGYPFSDKGINGETYTITVSEVLQHPSVGMIKKLPRRVNLYSISEPYFKYMVSVLSLDCNGSALKGNILSLGLMEPDRIYSNIEGGTGVMGSYNLSTSHVDLLLQTGGWPTNEYQYKRNRNCAQ